MCRAGDLIASPGGEGRDARHRPGQRPFGGQRRLPSRCAAGSSEDAPASPTLVRMESPSDEEKFQSLLEQVRELHRLADEATRERARFDAYVQARLRWTTALRRLFRQLSVTLPIRPSTRFETPPVDVAVKTGLSSLLRQVSR